MFPRGALKKYSKVKGLEALSVLTPKHPIYPTRGNHSSESWIYNHHFHGLNL